MAKTINAANIAIGYDGTKLKAGVDMARADLAKLKSILKDNADPAKKMAYEQDLLNRALKAGAIDAATYARNMEAVKRAHAAAGTGTKALGLSMMGKAAGPLLGAFTAIGLVKKTIDELTESVNLAVEAEKRSAIFGAITGSQNIGDALLQQLKDLRKEGIALSTSSQVAQTMLSFGMAADEVVPSLTRIAMITGADAERMKMLGLAFAQSAAAGRLMGQDLLQMVNAGFNPLQEISRVTGIELIELKKRMEEAKISTDLVKLAFESATGEAGRFNHVLEAQKNTVSGQFRQLQADIEAFKTGLGQELMPLMRDVAGIAKNISESLKSEEMQRFFVGARVMFAGMQDLPTGRSTRGRAVVRDEMLRQQQELLNKHFAPLSQEHLAEMLKVAETPADLDMKKRMTEELNAKQKLEHLKAMSQAMELRQQQKMFEQLEKEERLRQNMFDTAQQYLEAQLTPMERLKAEVLQIQKLFDAGLLTAEQAKRAGLDAIGKMDSGSTPNNSARYVTAGTDEAYRLMTGQMDSQQKIAQDQKRLMEVQVELQKELVKNTKDGGITIFK